MVSIRIKTNILGKIVLFAGKNKELQKICNLINGGKFSKASDKLIEFMKKDHKPETSIRAQMIKALLTTNMFFWEKGLGILEAVISESKTLGVQLLLIDAFIVKANCLLFGEQFKKTILLIEETEKKLDKNLKPDEDGYWIRKAWLLGIKGNCYMWLGDIKHAQEIAKQSLPIVKSLSDSEILFNYYGLLGDNEFHLDAFENAIVHYQAGLQLAKDTKNDLKKCFFSSRLMESNRSIGRFTLAIEHCDLAIESVKKLGYNSNWMIYHKAYIYLFSGELENAVLLLKEVLPSLEHETTLKEFTKVVKEQAMGERIPGFAV